MVEQKLHFQWCVTYKDGSELRQYSEDGTENKIRLDDVSMLSWIPLDRPWVQLSDVIKRYDYNIKEGQKPVICFRKFIKLGAPVDQVRCAYLIGHEEKREDGVNIRNILYIQPPFRMKKLVSENGKKVIRTYFFEGCVEQSDDKKFHCALDRWQLSIGDMFDETKR